MSVYSVDKLTAEARRLAAEYRRVTGKVLPISGEIAVNDAIRLLDLEPATEPGAGYDAIRRNGEQLERLQIKARVVFEEKKGPAKLGQLKLEKDWDFLLMVLMDEHYEPTAIFEATRAKVKDVMLDKEPSKRGTLTAAQLKHISRRIWSRDAGAERSS